MIVPQEILDFGMDLNTIIYLHSKTKLSFRNFNSIAFIRYPRSGSILFRLEMPPNTEYNYTRRMTIEISKKKLRDIKLNKILLD